MDFINFTYCKIGGKSCIFLFTVSAYIFRCRKWPKLKLSGVFIPGKWWAFLSVGKVGISAPCVTLKRFHAIVLAP